MVRMPSARPAASEHPDAKLVIRSLSPTSLELEARRPLVFLNACHTGVTGFSLTGIAGWAEGFLSAGAGAFIGAYWAIEDAPEARFTEVFYTAVLGGSPIAAALRQARLAIREEFPGDPTWLAYTLYAHPLAVSEDVEDATAEPEEAAIPSPGRGERSRGRPVPPGSRAATQKRERLRLAAAAILAAAFVAIALATRLWPAAVPSALEEALAIFSRLGMRLREARDLYLQSRRVAEDLGRRIDLAASLTNLGEIAFLEGDLERARELHENARRLNQESGAREGEAYDLFRLGMVRMARDELAHARASFEEALGILDGVFPVELHQLQRTEVRLALADLELSEENFGDARKLARQAEQSFLKLGSEGRTMLAQTVLARAFFDQDLGKARAVVDQARQNAMTYRPPARRRAPARARAKRSQRRRARASSSPRRGQRSCSRASAS